MNLSIINQIYADLKEHIESESEFGARVLRKALRKSDRFPIVVVELFSNISREATLDFKEQVDELRLKISIYAKDKQVGGKIISDVMQANELAVLVDQIMSKKYRFQMIKTEEEPNIDNTIYRLSLRYKKNILTNKNFLY